MSDTPPPRRPLTTRECADIMGVSTDYVWVEIRDGRLKAENVAGSGKRASYRVHEEDFLDFLKRIKWSRIPTLRTGTN